MKVSKRAQAVPPSATMAVTSRAKELKAQGVDVVNFAAGEPDFDTPDFIKAAAVDALSAGQTKYTAAAGINELKNVISEKLQRDNNLTYSHHPKSMTRRRIHGQNLPICRSQDCGYQAAQ